MVGFKFPLDAYALAVPLAYACAAFGGLIYHTVSKDPEMTRTPDFYNEEEKVGKIGDEYLHKYKRYFDARINRHSLGVFNNDYKIN